MKKKNTINIKELSETGYFLFMTMMQAAIRMDELGKNKDDFISLAEEIWNSMEMNDKEHLKKSIIAALHQDLKDSLGEDIKFS